MSSLSRTSRSKHLRMVAISVGLFTAMLAGCGGSDSETSAPSTTEGVVTTEATTSMDDQMADDVDPAADDADPAANSDDPRTGYIEWKGERSDYIGAEGAFDPLLDDSGQCLISAETDSEGNDDYLIWVGIDDDTDLRVQDEDGKSSFLFGSTGDPIEVTDLEITRDGDTVTGSGTTPDGPLEFSFTC